MYLKDLLNNINLVKYTGNLDIDISNISYDSRKISNKDLYICLPGTKTDGHNYIQEAIKKGAQAIVVSNEWYEKNKNELNETITFLVVPNTRLAFSKISANFYNYPASQLKIIGVTGTNGKTTTTHFIEKILKDFEYRTGLIGTIYYRYNDITLKASHTTPQALELQKILRDMVDANTEYVIMEVSSHALEQRRVQDIKFKIGVLTNITQDHLDYHLTMDNYKQAKLILFKELLTDDGTAVLNADDNVINEFLPHIKNKVITYGINNNANLYAYNIETKSNGTQFNINGDFGKVKINLPLVGLFNVYNALAALSSCVALDMPLERCAYLLENAPKVRGRMEVITPLDFPFAAIVDYAHSPDGLSNILKTARQFTKNKLIVVFGCGGDRDKNKRPIMGSIAQNFADIVIITSDNPRTEDPDSIIQDILKGVNSFENVIIEKDREKAIFLALDIAKEGDIVIVAGKGHETYQIFKDKTIHFDDREVIEKGLVNLVKSGKVI